MAVKGSRLTFVGRESLLPEHFKCDGNAHDVLHAMQAVMRKAARRVMHEDVDRLVTITELAETHVRDAMRDLVRRDYISEMPLGWFVDRACGCDYGRSENESLVKVANLVEQGVPSSHRRDDRRAIPTSNRESANRIEALYDELLPGVAGALLEKQRRLLLRYFIELALDNRSLYTWALSNALVRRELSLHIVRWMEMGVPPRYIADMMQQFWIDAEAQRIEIKRYPHRTFVAWRAEFSDAVKSSKPDDRRGSK